MYNDTPGISGLHEAFEALKAHKDEGLSYSVKVYKESMYIKNKLVLEFTVKWTDKVTQAAITRLFRSKQKIEEDENTFPLEAAARVDEPEDIFTFLALSDDAAEEISPEDNEACIALFEEACRRSSKKFTAYLDEKSGISYVCALNTPTEIETNETPYLPFDFISKREELRGLLDKHTIFPPAEIDTAEGVLKRIREINNARVEINDIDFSANGEYINVLTDGDLSFCCSTNIIPDIKTSETENGIPGYYLMAIFTEAAKKLKKKDEIPAVEYRECIYLLIETTSASSEADSAKKKKKTKSTSTTGVTKEVVPAATQTSFPGIYAGEKSVSSTGSSKDVGGVVSNTAAATQGRSKGVPADDDYDSLDDAYNAMGY